jgi:adenine-specific DNA-methyltransferase
MTTQTVTLDLLELLYQKLRLGAAQPQRTVEDELLEVLATAVPLTDVLPADLSAAITPLATLNDADLWRAAQTQLPANVAARLEELHLKRQHAGLTGQQESEAAALIRQYERATLIKSTGAHYTPKILADFVAQRVLEVFQNVPPSTSIRILDPAVGDGELLHSLLLKLPTMPATNIEVHGFDTSHTAIEMATNRLQYTLPSIDLNLYQEDFLEFVLNNYGSQTYGDPFAPLILGQFDVIIANPPYVRTQVMGSDQSRILSRKFGLSGRVDLYHAFIEGIARTLKLGGIAGVIISNRFMTTKSGMGVRKTISDHFDILHVWDLGDTRIFDAAVLPAVLLLRKKRETEHITVPKFTTIYSTSSGKASIHCRNIIDALLQDGVVEVNDGRRFSVCHGNLEHGDGGADVWRISTEQADSWLARVERHTYCVFGDIGKIRVGVKTTADKVFIRTDWQNVPDSERPELLKPLTTHHIARRFKALHPENRRQILYTHHVIQGKRVAVDLREFPRSAKYLERHRAILEAREYVLAAGRNWFELWVPQDPDLWSHPKVVFRDISDKPTFWMDLDGSIVNGDCYWLTCQNKEQEDLLWLALAVGNSSFIEYFYDHKFNNKLYAGRRRFITQYVEKFPLPDPYSPVGSQMIQVSKEIYNIIPSPESQTMEKNLDQLVWQSFGGSFEEITR